MNDINSQCNRISNGIHFADENVKRRTLKHMVGELVDELLLIKISESMEGLEIEENLRDNNDQDGVYNYATTF